MHKHITKSNIQKSINLINIFDERVSFKSSIKLTTSKMELNFIKYLSFILEDPNIK